MLVPTRWIIWTCGTQNLFPIYKFQSMLHDPFKPCRFHFVSISITVNRLLLSFAEWMLLFIVPVNTHQSVVNFSVRTSHTDPDARTTAIVTTKATRCRWRCQRQLVLIFIRDHRINGRNVRQAGCYPRPNRILAVSGLWRGKPFRPHIAPRKPLTIVNLFYMPLKEKPFFVRYCHRTKGIAWNKPREANFVPIYLLIRCGGMAMSDAVWITKI